VYSGNPQNPGVLPDFVFGGNPDINYITVLVKKGEPIVPENVYGKVVWYDSKFTYKGVKRVREENGDDKTPWVESCWEVIGNNDTDNREYDSEVGFANEENEIILSQVLDDNGNPFLLFDWSTPYGGHSTASGYFIGKKVIKGRDWGIWLSDSEMKRLGIDLSFEQIERLAKEGSIGDSEEDVDHSEDDGEDDEDDDEIEDDEEHETGARKRKASHSGSGTAGKRSRTQP
jgi:hypothetical protein